MNKMQLKICKAVPPGEIWFVDSKKLIVAKVVDVDSGRTVDVPMPVPDFPTEIDLFKIQFKSHIDLMLQEKTGWGRVELRRRLWELIDDTGVSNLFEGEDDLPF